MIINHKKGAPARTRWDNINSAGAVSALAFNTPYSRVGQYFRHQRRVSELATQAERDCRGTVQRSGNRRVVKGFDGTPQAVRAELRAMRKDSTNRDHVSARQRGLAPPASDRLAGICISLRDPFSILHRRHAERLAECLTKCRILFVATVCGHFPDVGLRIGQ